MPIYEHNIIAKGEEKMQLLIIFTDSINSPGAPLDTSARGELSAALQELTSVPAVHFEGPLTSTAVNDLGAALDAINASFIA